MIFLHLKNYLVGEICLIFYKDIVVVCKKYRKNLKPNIYINTKFLRVGESIRGNIIIASYKNKSFVSLTKEQAITYMNFLKDASFHYNNTTNSHYTRKDIKFFKNLEKEVIPYNTEKKHSNAKRNNNNEVLQMILAIQTIILKFIKNNEN